MTRSRIIAATVVLAIGFGIFWAVRHTSASAQIEKIKTLETQLASAEKLPEAERRTLREQLRTEFRNLPEADRERLGRERRDGFEKRMQERIHEVLSLPPAQRVAALDKQINEEEKRKKEWEQRSQSGKAGKGKGGPGKGGAGKGGPGKGGAGKGGGGRNLNDQAKNQFRKARLDNTSPRSRAEMVEYRRQMEQRRAERGLPPSPWPRRG